MLSDHDREYMDILIRENIALRRDNRKLKEDLALAQEDAAGAKRKAQRQQDRCSHSNSFVKIGSYEMRGPYELMECRDCGYSWEQRISC